MHVTIAGTGYVGLVTGACLANTGNDVTCFDLVQEKIDKLNQGHCIIYEPGLEELLARNLKANRLHFTADKKAAYRDAQIIFICVGTPSTDDGQADISAVLAVARDVGEAIEASPTLEHPRIVVVKSTVPVGTNGKVKAEIASRTAKPFAMASNPEFLKEGAAILDFNKPDRVVVGVEDKQTGDTLRDLYDPFVRQGNPIFIMDIPSAEMVKYAANAMLATKISFINEIANLCDAYGADVDEVRRGMCADQRIGRHFLYPGLGYGGSCFPKDVLACIQMGQQATTPTLLMQAVHQVNQAQRQTFLAKLSRHFAGDDLAGKRIALWGIAFKPGTDDIRDAPAITLIQVLLDRGADVVAYDPAAADNARQIFGDRIQYVDNMWDAVDQADALVIATNWGEFMHPDFDDLKKHMKQPVIFDGRNIYRRQVMQEHGFTYYSVGRASVSA